jgi:uridine kinase
MHKSSEILIANNIEHAKNHPELVKYAETETKLFVTEPAAFAHFRDQAVTIEQHYLSTPQDEFSLRLRKTYLPDGPRYTADLKDRGEYASGALRRTEIPVSNLSQQAYEYYANHPLAVPLVQHRAYITKEMSIDFIDGFEYPVIEIETEDAARRAELLELLEGNVMDVTETGAANKERIAHLINGSEHRASPESLDVFTDRVVREMVAHYVSGKNHVVVGLTGMSGSGKTTVTRLIQQKLVENFGDSFNPAVVSTDDYHWGKAALDAINGEPWTAWDDPRTYNTVALAEDLTRLKAGDAIDGRRFDFETEEPILTSPIPAAPFVIVEGLYAGSKDLEDVRDLHFALPSSIATSIGRDVRRLIIENRANRAFPTPESRLKYQLEEALPLYLEQERPRRNGYSASCRAMAERAGMLEQLRRAPSATQLELHQG